MRFPVHLKYTVTKAALQQFARLQVDIVMIVAASGSFLGGLMLITELYRDGVPNSAGALGHLLGRNLLEGVLLGLGVVLFVMISYPIRMWRMHRNNPLVLGDMELTTDEQGMDFKHSRGASRMNWSDFQGFKENGHVFALCLNKSVGIPIPKQGMSPELVQEVRDHVSQKLKRLRRW